MKSTAPFLTSAYFVRKFINNRRSDNARKNRNLQNFFINGRYVKSRTAMAALEQAYTSYIASERFPCCVLFLDIDPTLVDVNVHPAKLEVKFSNEKPVFETVYYAVRAALEKNSARPDVELPSTKRKVTDAYVPIEDGRRESAKSQQIEAELYRKAIPLSQNGMPANQSQSKQNSENPYFSRVSAQEYRQSYSNIPQSSLGVNQSAIRQGVNSQEKVDSVSSTPIKIVEPIKIEKNDKIDENYKGFF